MCMLCYAFELVLLQLRYLQTLNSISAENNSTIIFPVPIDIMSEFMQTSSSAQSSVLGQWAASTGGRIIICVKHCIMRIDDLGLTTFSFFIRLMFLKYFQKYIYRKVNMFLLRSWSELVLQDRTLGPGMWRQHGEDSCSGLFLWTATRKIFCPQMCSTSGSGSGGSRTSSGSRHAA